MKDYTPEILRALRKYHGITQVNMAKILGVRQGTLSKLESGVLELSATQWISLCNKYEINPQSIIEGRINHLGQSNIVPGKSKLTGNFKVDKKYTNQMGSSVRSVYPLIQFMVKKIGMDETKLFFKSIKVDFDYFTIQSLPINILLVQDIYTHLKDLNVVSNSNVEEIYELVSAEKIHNFSLRHIKATSNIDMNFKRFIKEIDTKYENNTSYTFVGADNCYIQATNNDCIDDFHLTDEFKDFRMRFNASHFNQISKLFGHEMTFKAEADDNGWKILSR